MTLFAFSFVVGIPAAHLVRLAQLLPSTKAFLPQVEPESIEDRETETEDGKFGFQDLEVHNATCYGNDLVVVIRPDDSHEAKARDDGDAIESANILRALLNHPSELLTRDLKGKELSS